MRHARILEHANYVRDHVHFAQLGQRLAHALFLHAAQVHVIHRCIGDFLGTVELGQLQQPRLRDFGHAHVRRRRPALPLDVRLRQNAEQRRFPDLWQSNNSRLHSRPFSRFSLRISYAHKPLILAHPPRSTLSESSVLARLIFQLYTFLMQWSRIILVLMLAVAARVSTTSPESRFQQSANSVSSSSSVATFTASVRKSLGFFPETIARLAPSQLLCSTATANEHHRPRPFCLCRPGSGWRGYSEPSARDAHGFSLQPASLLAASSVQLFPAPQLVWLCRSFGVAS